MTRFKNYKRQEDGIAAVEFALIAPVFIFLFIGLVDFGFYLNSKMNVQNMSRSVAEYVAASKDDGQVQNLFEELKTNTGETNVSVTTAFECECSDGVIAECPLSCGEGDFERRFISVDVSGNYSPLLPYPGISDGVTISKTSRARVD